jgi:hypothetical protein
VTGAALERGLAAQKALQAAMVGGDIDRLRRLLSPELRWVHASGIVDTRDALVLRIAGGALRVRRMEATPAAHGIGTRSFVLAGSIDLQQEVAGEIRSARNYFLGVWTNADDDAALRLSFWQSTRFPAGD